ncbi:MAG: CHAT domain-containing protein, partial [Rhodocyclaceae bacterium]|nr:CHAT domain-containing protein [Rhodocyclaceae bacterium]
ARLLRMPHAIAGGEAQEIEVGRARVQLVNVLGDTFEVPGFAHWAGGSAAYRTLELRHVRDDVSGEGYALSLREPDGTSSAQDFIVGAAERLVPSLAPFAQQGEEGIWVSVGLDHAAESPLLQSQVFAALAPDEDIELLLDEAAARLPWEYLLGERVFNGRLVRARSGDVGRAGGDSGGHAVLVAAVAGLKRTSPTAIDPLFRSARYEVETLGEASATELLTRLHRRPWRVLHLESLIDQAGNPDFDAGLTALPIGDGALLRPGDLEQLKVLPDLVVIRGRARMGSGFAASWGEALRERMTSAVLVNDWHIPDEAASVFLDSFYEVLTSGSSAAEAVLIARLETRRHFPGSLAWAAFQLHGDGEYRLPRVAQRKAATKAAKAKAAEPYDLRAIRALEQRGVPEPGLYAIDASAVPPSLNGPDAFSMLQGRALLFIHGMGSSMLGSFAGMWSSDNLAAWQQLASAYSGRMLCFEHWGLSRSPLENALELVRALPFGIELTVLSVSDGGLIGELLCRAGRVADQPGWEDDDFWESAGRTEETAAPFDEADFALFDGAARETLERLAKEMMSKSLRIVDFVRIACPVRGTTYPARAKQVFGGIARLMGTVGSHAGSLPLRLLDAIVDPERVPGLRAMEPTAPLIRMLNREGVRVDSELAIVAGTFRADSLAGRLKAGLLGLLVDRDNDMLVATESMFGGAARTRPARFVRFEGGDINHFSYLEQAEVVRTVVDRLLNGSPGPAWQIVPGEGAPAPIVVVVHDASQPSEVLEQCAAALAPLENEGRIRLFVASDRDPMLVDDGVRGPLTLALERARVLVVLLTPGLLRSSGLEYALHRLRDRLVDARCVVLPIEVLPTDLEQSALASLASMSPRRVLHPRSDDPEAWREVALTVARILDGAQGSGAAASARAGFAPAFDGAGEALKRSDWDKA